jgi:hypothetical protein
MAQQPVARKQSRLKRDEDQDTESRNGHEQDISRYEKQLSDYLQERIKPGLNRGAIPLLARSIAHELAQWNGAGDEDEEEPSADAQDEADEDFEDSDEDDPSAEADDEADDEEDDEAYSESDFEDDMHDLQAELGEDWILRFCVQGDDAWLTAEKEDGSQHIEAPTASVLTKAVKLLNKGGGRSG